ncbi:MAG: response regulator [Candidatus Omnitrophota bacterium]
MLKTKVLLIDDEADFIEVVKLRLEGWGYDVLTASSGRAGINEFINKKPGIIILDYMMPGMDGIEALKEIRKIDKKIPVIMFTAFPQEKAIDQAMKLGVCTFVPKISAYSDAENALRSALKIAEGNSEDRD